MDYITNEEIIKGLLLGLEVLSNNDNITILKDKLGKEKYSQFDEAYQAGYEMFFNENDY